MPQLHTNDYHAMAGFEVEKNGVGGKLTARYPQKNLDLYR